MLNKILKSKHFDIFVRNKTNKAFKAKMLYTDLYNKKLAIENSVLFESYHGTQIASNEFYLLKDLCADLRYSKIKPYVAARKHSVDSVKERLEINGLDNVEVIEINSKKYCTLLCTSKYLINGTTFPDYFIKRDEQLYLNTWHGTPLKHLGRKDKNAPNMIANGQRNFMMSDYLLYPNNHTREVMMNDYMLNKAYCGKLILAGYPRNKIFYDNSSRGEIRNSLGIRNERVITYMPTWRGSLGAVGNTKTIAYTYLMLERLNSVLSDGDVLYVKLHHMMAKIINLSEFDNVREFPNEYETYEFLNITDVLITDYSSVMFDFANRNKEIILYTYDEADYLENKGVYISLDELPFRKASTLDELITYINNPVDIDYSNFISEYCSRDNKDNSKLINSLFFLESKDSDLDVIECLPSSKEKVLIYGANLAKNGITTSLLSLLEKIDIDDKDIFITFNGKTVKKHINVLHSLNENIDYIPYWGLVNHTKFEALFLFLYYKINLNTKLITKFMDKIYKREVKRIYPNQKFDYVIQFNGYDKHCIQLLERIPSKLSSIYVHNNMWAELKTRKNCHKPTMDYAYSHYDNIAIVTEQLRESVNKFHSIPDRIKVVENTHCHDLIVDKGSLPVSFDSDTECNLSLEELKLILNNDKIKKFVNVARFSYEKGHNRLVKAFERAYDHDNDCCLIIIGGHGELYSELLEQLSHSSAKDAIIIIKSMTNPFPVMKCCDLFVFSSFYEGLGLVMLESLSLGVPVISTDIPGPRDFLNKGYGTLVPDNEDGLYHGMMKYLDGTIKHVEIDWESYNKKTVAQFYELLH